MRDHSPQPTAPISDQGPRVFWRDSNGVDHQLPDSVLVDLPTTPSLASPRGNLFRMDWPALFVYTAGADAALAAHLLLSGDALFGIALGIAGFGLLLWGNYAINTAALAHERDASDHVQQKRTPTPPPHHPV